MKYIELIIAIIIVVLLMSYCSLAHSQPLTTSDYLYEAAFDTELLIDAHQTQRIKHFCDGRDNCSVHETNLLIGASPSEAKVRNYMIGSALIHAGITYLLPPEDHKMWQLGSITFEAVVIGKNKQLGLGFKF